MADIDASDKRIRELQDSECREAEAAEARAGWEPIVRPRTDRRSETLAEAEFRAFLSGQTQSKAIDLDLSGVIAE